MISNSFSSGNTMDVRSRGCSCSISRREDKPQPGRTGRACSVSTAIPSGTSWSGTLREGWMPRWRYMPPLALYAPAGKRPSLSPKVLASLEQVLQRPEGLASYETLRQWLRRTHGVEVKYKTLYSLVRTRFDTKLKMPCLSQTKKACSHTCIPGELSGTPRATQPVRQSSSPPSVQPR
jgi:hypothetical protein